MTAGAYKDTAVTLSVHAEICVDDTESLLETMSGIEEQRGHHFQISPHKNKCTYSKSSAAV